jgi:LmbE family N-acetylglucosaminyl deacetylase
MAMRELGTPSLIDALAYLDLLAEVKPEKLEQAALRWHGRLELEASMMTLGESQLALAALAGLRAGEREAIDLLRKLLRRVRPTLVHRLG